MAFAEEIHKHKRKDIRDFLHAFLHQSGGDDQLDIDTLAGIISNVQHGTKATMPNAHHSKNHFHILENVSKMETDVKNIASETYETLIETTKTFQSRYATSFTKISFCHQILFESANADRGVRLQLYSYDDLFGEIALEGGEYHQFTGITGDYITMSLFGYFYLGIAPPIRKFIIKWRCDNASWEAWSKNRHLIVEDLSATDQWAGDI